MSCELGSSISFSSCSTDLCCKPIPSSNAYREQEQSTNMTIKLISWQRNIEDHNKRGNLHTVRLREMCRRAAWGRRCVPLLGSGPWWGGSPPCSSNTTPDVSGRKGWNGLPAQSCWELPRSETSQPRCVRGRGNVIRLVSRGSLTARLLLWLLILQDAERHARMEAAKLVGEERQEAPAEIWGEQKQLSQTVITLNAACLQKEVHLSRRQTATGSARGLHLYSAPLASHKSALLSGHSTHKHTHSFIIPSCDNSTMYRNPLKKSMIFTLTGVCLK